MNNEKAADESAAVNNQRNATTYARGVRKIENFWLPEGKELRTTKTEKPFFWVSASAFKRIDNGGLKNPDTAKLVYVALCMLASEAKSDCFETEVAFIGWKVSVTDKTVRNYLPDLERLGLVHVERSVKELGKPQPPNKYALLRTNFRKQEGSKRSSDSAGTKILPGSENDNGAELPGNYNNHPLRGDSEYKDSTIAAPHRSLEAAGGSNGAQEQSKPLTPSADLPTSGGF